MIAKAAMSITTRAVTTTATTITLTLLTPVRFGELLLITSVGSLEYETMIADERIGELGDVVACSCDKTIIIEDNNII